VLDNACVTNGTPSKRRGLAAVGEDPDPRFTWANERTFLAWNRTALALIAAGLAAAELLKTDPKGLRLAVAIPLIILGAVVAFTSYSRWETSERLIRLGQPLEYSKLGLTLAVGVGLAGVAAIVLVIVDVAG
jgi:putative membrane protein